jgi:putative NADPH-quinone reductase
MPTAPLALVIVAHPRADSFTRSLATAAVDGLSAGGWDVEVLDLAAIGFRAAMSAEELTAYRTEALPPDPMAAAHATLVAQATALVFVYPTWWSGLPAILKGWLERVLVTGVAFTLDSRTQRVKPALGHIRWIVGISTYGSPRTYISLINDNGRRILTRALRLVCGRRTRTRWLGLYSIDTATAEQRFEFIDRVRRVLNRDLVAHG